MNKIDYFNRKAATISILRDWRDQNWKINRAKRVICDIDNRMTSLSASLSTSPVKGGGSRREESLCASIDKKTVAEYGLRQAEEYLKDVAPCWERLSQEEQKLLTARYIDYSEQNGIETIMHSMHICKTEAYNKSNAALEHLSRLLFW